MTHSAAEESTQAQLVPRDGVALGLPIVQIGPIPFSAVTEEQTIRFMIDQLDAGRGGWLISMNLDVVRQCAQSPSIARLCSSASFFVADGMPLIWASRLQGARLPERVTGSDLIVSLTKAAAEADKSVFFLGGEEGVAAEAAEVLKSRFPGLRVAGVCCPPIGFETNDDEMEAIRTVLVATKPDIVYVALGFPKQERVIPQLREILPAAWWTGIGVSFSFLTGRIRRAPAWMQKSGLEWLHRLVQQPRHLFKRYVFHDIPFAFQLFWRSWRQRRRSGSGI